MTQEVVALSLEDIMPLRVKVLRNGTPVTHCNYPEDTYEDVIHLGVKNENSVVGTSSWFRKDIFAVVLPRLVLDTLTNQLACRTTMCIVAFSRRRLPLTYTAGFHFSLD